MTTSAKLQEAALTFGWKHQGLHANQGKVHKDFFVKGPTLIVVTYDLKDRISTARRSRIQFSSAVDLDKLGTGTTDKIKRVVSWFRVEDK